MGGAVAVPAHPRSCWSEGVEGVHVEASHDGQPVAEIVMQVAVGGAVVGEASLVDVLVGRLGAEGEGPPGEGVAGRVGAGGASSWAARRGEVVLAVMSVSFLSVN